MKNDNTVEFTYLRSISLLTMRFSLKGKDIITRAPMYFREGIAHHHRIDFESLPELMDGMAEYEAIMAGVMSGKLFGAPCLNNAEYVR